MGEVGTDAFTPGDRELIEGHEVIQGLFDTQPGIKIISANITNKAGDLIWDRYAVFERGGVKIGVTGVTGGSSYSFNVTRGTQKVDDFAFLDSRETLREVLPELKEKCDITVVLLHETPGDARRIVDEIPGMDVVIVGHNPGYIFNPDRIANTLLVRGGNRGQYLSVLDLTLDSANTIVDYNGEGKPLGKTVAKDEAIEAIVKPWEDDFNEREKASKRKEAVDKAMLEGTEKFIGAGMCQRCHADEYTTWAETSHANAILTKYDGDHPVAEGVDANVGVQCEHCHGLGTAHGTVGMVTQVGIETCQGCHSSEGVADIDFADSIAKGFHH